MSLAEKDLLVNQLRQQKREKEPVYRRTKEDELVLEKLQAENGDLKDRIQQVDREISELQRPTTALMQDNSALDR